MRALLAALLIVAAVPASAQPGTVVVVGGALKDDNAAVFGAMIAAMPADAPDVVVIPAASGFAGSAAERFADALALYGVDRSRVALVQVAMVDDPETSGVDESGWHAGASDARQIARVARAGLIWFAGGDQARIIATLVQADGSDTPMLAIIRKRLADGAVVGGTSAGAAIMGEHMIGCGSAVTALVTPVSSNLADCATSDEASDSVPLVLSSGLAFLPDIVFDQHFSERGRLTRLVRAVACIDDGAITGIGIDEDTAFVFDLAGETGDAVGRGTITMVDPADRQTRCAGAVMDNVRLARIAGKGQY